jgi:malonyl-CoA/methylmalonyl-CoA synthetase
LADARENRRRAARRRLFHHRRSGASIDEDGYVHIVGRNKDLIISGGYNIYPKEIELVLDDQPGVLESAVIGVPHPDFGETVLGVLVPEPGQSPDIEAIMAQVKETLARFKHPRDLIVMDELPRNTMGKVQKNILREEYKDCSQPRHSVREMMTRGALALC